MQERAQTCTVIGDKVPVGSVVSQSCKQVNKDGLDLDVGFLVVSCLGWMMCSVYRCVSNIIISARNREHMLY